MKISQSNTIELLIFTDKSSIEIFANNGQTMSNTVYPFPDSNDISIFSEEGAKINLEFYPFVKTSAN
jgi:sucrose-6-phosphate hydrolase SacC (GH32 family)